MSGKGTHQKLMCSIQAFGQVKSAKINVLQRDTSKFRSEVNRAIVDVSHTPDPCLLHVKPESGANWDKTWSLYTGH